MAIEVGVIPRSVVGGVPPPSWNIDMSDADSEALAALEHTGEWMTLSVTERAFLIAVALSDPMDSWCRALIDRVTALGHSVSKKHGYRVLHNLTDQGLLEEKEVDAPFDIYRLTPRGQHFLADARELLRVAVDQTDTPAEDTTE